MGYSGIQHAAPSQLSNQLPSQIANQASIHASQSLYLYDSLTNAELQIIRHFASGHVPNEIAEISGTKISTVRSHVRSIYSKLGVSSCIGALYKARALGLIHG